MSHAERVRLWNKGKSDSSTVVTYTIKFYYTVEFAQVTDDIMMYFNQVRVT